MVVFAIVVVPPIIRSDNNSSQTVRGNTLASCRSKANIPVQEANRDIQASLTEINSIGRDLFLLVIRAFRLNLEGDKSQFTSLLQESDSIQDRLTLAGKGLERAASQYDLALNEYEDAVRQSVSDPDKFLAKCGLTLGDPAGER